MKYIKRLIKNTIRDIYDVMVSAQKTMAFGLK